MTSGFQVLEVFCKQNLITGWGLPRRKTWSDRITTYTLSHSLLLFFASKKTIQFCYCQQDSAKWGFEHERVNVTACRSHSVKTAIFHIISHFSLNWKVYFFTWSHDGFQKPAIHLSSNWREREKVLAKWEKWKVYRWHFINCLANHFSHLAFRCSHQTISIFMKCRRGR